MQNMLSKLLSPYISPTIKNTLMIADENEPLFSSLANNTEISILTNRFDRYLLGQEQGFKIQFSDFQFDAPMNSYQRIIYRVSKERPVVNHLINRSFDYLIPGGDLVLIGHNQEGIKTHIKNAEKRFQIKAEVQLDKQFRCARLIRGDSPGPQLDDKNYPELRPFTTYRNKDIISKPGQFGWNKTDKGSVYLAQHFSDLFNAHQLKNGKLLDLGCGYGYLSIMANELGDFTIYATDNNAAAVDSCKANFKQFDIKGEVTADDCAIHINEIFDGIICNPPFHSGFDVSSDLTDKFLHNTARLLKPGAPAFYVCNEFIGVEKRASSLFKKVTTHDRSNGFKILTLIR